VNSVTVKYSWKCQYLVKIVSKCIFKSILQTLWNTCFAMSPPRLPLKPHHRLNMSSHSRLNGDTYNVIQWSFTGRRRQTEESALTSALSQSSFYQLSVVSPWRTENQWIALQIDLNTLADLRGEEGQGAMPPPKMPEVTSKCEKSSASGGLRPPDPYRGSAPGRWGTPWIGPLQVHFLDPPLLEQSFELEWQNT